MEPDATTALAADAYVYGSPLVRRLSAVQAGLQEGYGELAPAPFNDFAHADGPATPRTHTPYAPADLVDALAQLDLSGGPVRLHVPDMGGAYHVLQFVDAWSNVFAYLGDRTGPDEGDWLVVPPGWAGTVPEVAGVIDAPTSVISVLGRLACDGPDDMPRVRALQQELTLTHLGDRAHRTGLPATESGVPGELRFFEELRVWMADFPCGRRRSRLPGPLPAPGAPGGGDLAVRVARAGPRTGAEAGARARQAAGGGGGPTAHGGGGLADDSAPA